MQKAFGRRDHLRNIEKTLQQDWKLNKIFEVTHQKDWESSLTFEEKNKCAHGCCTDDEEISVYLHTTIGQEIQPGTLANILSEKTKIPWKKPEDSRGTLPTDGILLVEGKNSQPKKK